MPFDGERGREQSKTNPLRSQQMTQGRQVGMHQRLAAGKNDPPDLEFSQAREMRLQVVSRNLPHPADFPDVAHHATAVAPVVRKKHENRQLVDVMFGCADHADTLFPARQIPLPRCGVVSLISHWIGARTRSLMPSTAIHSSPSRSSR